MSSLVDNIILMNLIELGDTFRLGLTVGEDAREPGQSHDPRVRGRGRQGHARAAARSCRPRCRRPAFSGYSRPDLARARAPAAASRRRRRARQD